VSLAKALVTSWSAVSACVSATEVSSLKAAQFSFVGHPLFQSCGKDKGVNHYGTNYESAEGLILEAAW
jgi:hypothetical protein